MARAQKKADIENPLSNEAFYARSHVEARAVASAPVFGQPPVGRRRIVGRRVRLAVGVVLLAIVAFGGYRAYGWYVSPERAAAKAEAQRKALVAQAGKLMLLPEEDPVVYTVDDPAQLAANQPFFTGSQKDDVLLVFPQNAKAVIYSPEREIIVNAGPITFDAPQQGTAVSRE